MQKNLSAPQAFISDMACWDKQEAKAVYGLKGTVDVLYTSLICRSSTYLKPRKRNGYRKREEK